MYIDVTVPLKGADVGKVQRHQRSSKCEPYTAVHGPPDLTVPGFGVPVGSAYLSARRTFGRPIGRPKVRPYLRPADSAGRRYGLIRHPPLYYYPQILTPPPLLLLTRLRPPPPFWHTTNSPTPRSPQPPPLAPKAYMQKFSSFPSITPPPLAPKAYMQ